MYNVKCIMYNCLADELYIKIMNAIPQGNYTFYIIH